MLLLSTVYVLFHVTKGVDYEEARLSTLLVATLLATLRDFKVRSLISFWLLERRESGIDFDWKDSLIRTSRFLSFQGDPTLHPHTRHAVWFLDSLYWLSSSAFLYVGFVLFRPAVDVGAHWGNELVVGDPRGGLPPGELR